MHGVRKVERTAEQKAAKQKERDVKVQIYQKARDRLFHKQRKDEFDDEVLELTQKLLSANPDIYTLWNFRRIALLRLEDEKKVKIEKAENTEETEESNDEIPNRSMDSIYKHELSLTEICLEENPKSYGAWHQRDWVLSRMENADFNTEIKLCNKALEFDERNFHCWDHRRIVCKLANVPPEEELKFSDKKVNDNFSNYSAWHYRSSLLPRLFPDPQAQLPIEASVLKKELRLATNAFYTDPEDQSAWFYTSWLFQQNTDSAPKLLLCNVDFELNRIVVSFDKAVRLATNTRVIVNDCTIIEGHWSSVDTTATFSRLWVFRPLATLSKFDGKTTLIVLGYEPITMDSFEDMRADWLNITGLTNHLLGDVPPDVISEALGIALTECDQLVEMEPENKWPLLIATLCMKRLNPKEHSKKVIENLEQLCQLDEKRAKFYSDLSSEFKFSLHMIDADRKWNEIRLIRSKLTSLPSPHILVNVSHIDVSSNRIRSLLPLKFALSLKNIMANENLLTDLEGLENHPTLESVHVASNSFVKADTFLLLKSCKRLNKLILCENEICQNEAELKILMEHFPHPNFRVIPFWLF